MEVCEMQILCGYVENAIIAAPRSRGSSKSTENEIVTKFFAHGVLVV